VEQKVEGQKHVLANFIEIFGVVRKKISPSHAGLQDDQTNEHEVWQLRKGR
jgi:hypothetical protein